MSTNNTVQLNIATANTSKATKDVKSLKEQIKDLRNEMAGLTKGTAEYDQAAAQLGDLMHQQAEITESAKLATADYGQTLSNITSISAGVVGSLSAMNGVMNLIGASSDEAAEAMRKIQSLMAIVQGLNQLDQAEKAFKGLWTRIKMITAAKRTDTQETIKNSKAEGENAAATELDTKAKQKNAAASGVATTGNNVLAVSFKNLGRAIKSFMMSNPFTALIVGVSTVATIVSSILNRVKKAREEARDEMVATLDMYDNFDYSMDEAGMTVFGRQEMKRRKVGIFDTYKYVERFDQEIKRLEAEMRNKKSDFIRAATAGLDTEELEKELEKKEDEMRQAVIKKTEMELKELSEHLYDGLDNLNFLQRTVYGGVYVTQKISEGLGIEYLGKKIDEALDLHIGTKTISIAPELDAELQARKDKIKETEDKIDKLYAEYGKFIKKLRDKDSEEADKSRRAQEAERQKRQAAWDKARQDALNAINAKKTLDRQLAENAYGGQEIAPEEYYDRLIKAETDYFEAYSAWAKKYNAKQTEVELATAQHNAAVMELQKKRAETLIDLNKRIADSENYRGQRSAVDEARYQNAQNALTDQEGLRYAEQQEELFNAWWLKKFMLIEQYNKQELEKEREHNDELNRLAMERYAEEENVLKENFDADKGYEDTRFQNEMDALNARHEAKLISEQDYYLELERLEREHQEKMDELQADYDGGRNEIEANRIQTLRDIAQQRYEIEKDYYDRRLELDEAYISAYQTLSSSIGGILSKVQEQYSEGSRQYEKIQEASIIMDTVSGALSAFMSGVKSGIPAPGNFIYAGVLSALALAEGQLALNNLHSKKLSAGAANAPSVSAYQTVAYETGSDLQDSIRDQRVYVTETDITDTVNRVSVIESEASF